MNQLVPHPSATTRSPACGSTSTESAASASACRQQSGCDAISRSVSDIFRRRLVRVHARSQTRTSMNEHVRCMVRIVHQAERLSAILTELSEDGGVEVADLADALGGVSGDDPPRPRAAGGAAPALAHARRRRADGRALRAAAALQGRASPRREAPDRAGRGRADRRRHGGRPHRRHHLYRGRARAGRPRTDHRRDERAQHRERAGRASEPEAGRHRRHGAPGVLRAGRPAGRAVARRPAPGPRRDRRRRHRRARPAARPTTRSRRTPTSR